MRTLINLNKVVYQLDNSPISTGDYFVDLNSKSINQCLLSTSDKLHSGVDNIYPPKDCKKIIKSSNKQINLPLIHL